MSPGCPTAAHWLMAAVSDSVVGLMRPMLTMLTMLTMRVSAIMWSCLGGRHDGGMRVHAPGSTTISPVAWRSAVSDGSKPRMS